MKKNILLTLSFVFVAFFSAFAGEPKISFKEKAHDFGAIKEEKGFADCVFEFTNTGDAPLMIINVKPQCGCTVPTYSKKPIQPGKKGKIKIEFNPRGYAGEFFKTIDVRTNCKPNKLILRISGSVIPDK